MSVFAEAVKNFPELHTSRLTLRQCDAKDAATVVKCLAQFPSNSSWVDAYESRSVEKAKLAIRSWNNQFDRSRTTIPWAITDAKDKMVGIIKLFEIANRSRGEVGYWIAKPNWNKGYASDALTEVCRFAFENLGMHRLYATTDTTNAASRRVLEKAGFQPEGVLRSHTLRAGRWADSVLYGKLNTD